MFGLAAHMYVNKIIASHCRELMVPEYPRSAATTSCVCDQCQRNAIPEVAVRAVDEGWRAVELRNMQSQSNAHPNLWVQ